MLLKKIHTLIVYVPPLNKSLHNDGTCYNLLDTFLEESVSGLLGLETFYKLVILLSQVPVVC